MRIIRWMVVALACGTMACGATASGMRDETAEGGAPADASNDLGPSADSSPDAMPQPPSDASSDSSSDAPSDAAHTADSAHPDSAAGAGDAGGSPGITLPPERTFLDYQLGGAYPPPPGVGIVSRDRTAMPAAGLYNVCYVNGFQIQPGEEPAWMQDHPDLILRDAGGQPVIDTGWNEILVDVGTPAKRSEVAAFVGAWIDGCARSGFAAVEIDNLDSYTRSTGLLSADDAVAMIRLFADRAHADGLAIAQKNASELVSRRTEMGTDFVVAEECNHYNECDTYRAGYGDHILMIEYDRASFNAGCAAYPGLPLVLRDVDLVPAGTQGYVFSHC